jgi:hypothetical protein
MKRNIFTVAAVCMGMLAACDTTMSDPPAYLLPQEYQPLEVGKSITYQLDSIQYFETVENDTASWELKEAVTDTFYDNQGRLNFRIERSIRKPGESWQLAQVWSAMYNDNKLERVEENLRFIRLTAPVENGEAWDGHIYLSGLDEIPVLQQCNNRAFLEGWTFAYEGVGNAASYNGLDFANTLTVRQTGEQNLIEYNESEEVYAKGVGLVYRYFRHFTTQNICPTCEWEENTECGYSVRMSVIDYN